MTRDTLLTLLRGVTYKPGVELNVHDLDHGVGLQVVLFADDTVRADGMTKVFVDMTRMWPNSEIPQLKAEQLMEDVRLLVHNLERHEADEWLKFNGTAPFHPHPEARK